MEVLQKSLVVAFSMTINHNCQTKWNLLSYLVGLLAKQFMIIVKLRWKSELCLTYLTILY